MRILMLSQFYPPLLGGAERHVRDLSIDLVRRGHDVAVATLTDYRAPDVEFDRGVRVYRLRVSTERMDWLYSTSLPSAPPLPDPRLAMGLRRIIRQEQPQIVHAHDWLVDTFLPLKSWSGAKLIRTLHDYGLACAQKRLMRNGTRVCGGPGRTKCLTCAVNHYGLVRGPVIVGANRLMAPVERHSVDMFIPVSQAVASGNRLQEYSLPFQVIPNFVLDDAAVSQNDTTTAEYLRQLPTPGYLLYVGQLSRNKGVDVLLRAYATLTEHTAAPPLVLIGQDHPETALLLQDIPEGVVVFKNWPHHAVMQAFRFSLAGLVPSVWEEPSPTVAMEAMAVGRPVIASNIGGLPDIVADGDTGYLVLPGDIAALRHAIERLLSTPSLCERLGYAALQRVAEFQASTVVPRIEQVYEHLLLGQSQPTDARTWLLNRPELASRPRECQPGHDARNG